MGPVFAFDVGIVVFVISPGTGELDGDFAVEEIFQEGLIEKFIAVVGVEAKDWERQGGFNIFYLSGDFPVTDTIGGALLIPTGGNVDGVEGNSVDTGQ